MGLPAEQLDQEYSSPEFVRLSLAAAMTLDLAPGTFFRGARLGCINLLLTYPGGCKANCSFCGLARENQLRRDDPRYEKFIRVAWRAWALDEVLRRCASAPDWVERVCISMITHPRALKDTLHICREIRSKTDLPVSLLIAPTMLHRKDIRSMYEAGADRIGVAVDAATPELFEALRGRMVKGPHQWGRYWEIFDESVEVFGQGMVGVHLIHGLGEAESDLINKIDRARRMGGCTHLFCFFPEKFSRMAEHPQPPASGYRRIQMARWLIDNDLSRMDRMTFDDQGRVTDFGVSPEVYEQALASGRPFMTSGCPGASGEVACNRPYGNEKPGDDLRNFPFVPDASDMELIRRQICEY